MCTCEDTEVWHRAQRVHAALLRNQVVCLTHMAWLFETVPSVDPAANEAAARGDMPDGWDIGITLCSEGQEGVCAGRRSCAGRHKAELLLLIGNRGPKEAQRVRVQVKEDNRANPFVRISFPSAMFMDYVRRAVLYEVYRVVAMDMRLPVVWSGSGGKTLQRILSEERATGQVERVWEWMLTG